MVRNLFVTRLYESEINEPELLVDLAHSSRTLADDDEAGQRATSGTRVEEPRSCDEGRAHGAA